MSGVPADFHVGDILCIKTALPSRYVGAFAIKAAGINIMVRCVANSGLNVTHSYMAKQATFTSGSGLPCHEV